MLTRFDEDTWSNTAVFWENISFLMAASQSENIEEIQASINYSITNLVAVGTRPLDPRPTPKQVQAKKDIRRVLVRVQNGDRNRIWECLDHDIKDSIEQFLTSSE